MLAYVDQVAVDISAVEKAARDNGDLDGSIRELDNTLREANTTFDSRNEILTGVA
jgi:hypothetical protein